MKTFREELEERRQHYVERRKKAAKFESINHKAEIVDALKLLNKHSGYLMDYLRKKNANACIEADRAKKCNDTTMSFYWLGVAQAAKDLAQLITYHKEGDF